MNLGFAASNVGAPSSSALQPQIRLIYPTFMNAAAWCNQMSLALAPIGQLPTVRNDADWRTWAREVVRNTNLSVYQPPKPVERFKDWRQWASEFVRCLSTAGI